MKKQSFIAGAMILVLASFVNRVIGFIYRVLSIRIVGAEGIGLYEMVFPVYIMALVLATAGIPLAISRLVSIQIAKNNLPGAYKIFRLSLIFLFFSGLFFSFFLYLLLPILNEFAFSDPRANLIFRTMIPAVFVISISSAFRGFFLGMQQMLPSAFTQIIEQSVRVMVGLSLARYLLPLGLEYGVTGLAVGMVAGELVSLFIIIIIYSKYRPICSGKTYASISSLNILKDIYSLSIPITLSRFFTTIVLALEAIILPQRLQATGLTFQETTTIYGQYSGMALPLLVLPTVLTISLAITLVPAISEAAANNNYRVISSRIHKSLQLTTLIGIPSSIIFYFFGSELTMVLFNNKEAGHILRTLAFGSIFLYMQQTTTGILQGMGEVKASLVNSFIGGLIRLVGIYYLAAIPGYGIKGALLAVNISFVVISLLNTLSIGRSVGFRVDLKTNIFKPAWCGILMILFVKLFAINLLFFENILLQLASTIFISIFFYFICLMVHQIIKIKHFSQLFNSKYW